jgi:hypothetical protein
MIVSTELPADKVTMQKRSTTADVARAAPDMRKIRVFPKKIWGPERRNTHRLFAFFKSEFNYFE